MDKFFGYSGLICFWTIYGLLSIQYYFYDGTTDTYVLCVAMGSMFLWFDYKLGLTNVTRHIVHLPNEEDDDE